MAKSDVHWAYHAAPLHDRAAGSFVGLAIGDALGAPVSFTGKPKTWTGCIVSLEVWSGLTDWQKHGPDGRHWSGITKEWETPDSP